MISKMNYYNVLDITEGKKIHEPKNGLIEIIQNET